jgi:hypothetical protein
VTRFFKGYARTWTREPSKVLPTRESAEPLRFEDRQVDQEVGCSGEITPRHSMLWRRPDSHDLSDRSPPAVWWSMDDHANEFIDLQNGTVEPIDPKVINRIEGSLLVSHRERDRVQAGFTSVWMP